MLNWAILKHPMNWVTVTLMTILGFFFLRIILSPFNLPQKGEVGISDADNPGPWPYLATSQ